MNGCLICIVIILLIGYLVIPGFGFYYFSHEETAFKYIDSIKCLTNNTITPDMKSSCEYYDKSIFLLIIKMLFDTIVMGWSFIMLRLFICREKSYDPNRQCCSVQLMLFLCCLKIAISQPLTFQFVLYIICLGVSIVRLIFLRKSKITIDVEKYDKYNDTIDTQIHSTILMTIMIGGIVLLTIGYILLHCCCSEKDEIKETENETENENENETDYIVVQEQLKIEVKEEIIIHKQE